MTPEAVDQATPTGSATSDVLPKTATPQAKTAVGDRLRAIGADTPESEDGAVSGKVCMVTGATAGLGLATAQGLAQLGATVILVGRDLKRGTAAVERICAETESACVEYMLADLSAQAEIRRLAQEFQARYPRLDVLINNAGGFFHQRQESTDGIEMTWALNVLAPYLLTNLLLPELEAGAPARVINLTSFTQSLGRVRFNDPEGKRWYFRVQAYAQSKRAVLLLTSELARRLEISEVTANAVDPGFAATGIISQNASRRWSPIQRVLNMFACTPWEGAQVILYLATSPDVQGITGQCFRGTALARSTPASHSEAAAKRLWRICEAMTGEKRPGFAAC